MRYLFVTVALCAACASASPKPAGVPNARADGTFLYLSANDVVSASDADLLHSLSTACGGPCDSVFVNVEPETSADVLHRLVGAALGVAPPPRLFVLGRQWKRIEIVLDDVPCPIEVGVEAAGAYVVRDGERLAADPTCARWDAAICRGEDQVYDWPRLRSEIGAVDEVCVALDTGSIAELPAIHEMLRQPRVRLVRTKPAEAGVSKSSLTAVIKAAGPDLQWCLDGEVAEELVPMEATLRLAVHIDGTVTRAEVVHGKRTTAQFEACITDVAKKFRFDSPGPVAVVVEIPLGFQPGSRAPRRITDSE